MYSNLIRNTTAPKSSSSFSASYLPRAAWTESPGLMWHRKRWLPPSPRCTERCVSGCHCCCSPNPRPTPQTYPHHPLARPSWEEQKKEEKVRLRSSMQMVKQEPLKWLLFGLNCPLMMEYSLQAYTVSLEQFRTRNIAWPQWDTKTSAAAHSCRVSAYSVGVNGFVFLLNEDNVDCLETWNPVVLRLELWRENQTQWSWNK